MDLNLIDNEKIILTLLSKSKQLTKRELQKNGSMSWSTVTKIVNRLIEKNLIEESGIKTQNIQGKDAVTYCLKFEKPLFLSMDISYDYLRILLTNLRGDRITYYEEITPNFKEFKDLSKFLKKFIKGFLNNLSDKVDELRGIGISLPLFIVEKPESNFYLHLKKELEVYFDMKVEITGASNSYCYYLKFKEELPLEVKNQAMILNRRGLGASFILNGDIITGNNNLTGEIGHWKLGNNKIKCRCGQTGCIEGDVDFIEFLDKIKIFLEEKEKIIPREDEILIKFVKFFKNGDKEAIKIVDTIISSYETILSFISTSLDINNFTIVGLWDGLEEYFTDELSKRFSSNTFLNKEITISYLRYDQHNFISKGPVYKLLSQYIQI